jgi:pyruvate dehydrogenase E1 component
VADWSDEKIWTLTRGGHDPTQGLRRVRRGRRAQKRVSRPCILAKTVKGYGLGAAGEGHDARASA